MDSSSSNPVRIYADGVYDVFHFGHARQLQQAKQAFPNTHLIVGVSGQFETEALKGKTLMTEAERVSAVQSCKWVDEVLCPCPWVIKKEFITNLALDYIAHDAIPYVSSGSQDIYSEVKKMGKFYETKRTEGVSTSDLIVRIIKNREKFYERLIELGYSRESLNLGWTKYLWIRGKSLIGKIVRCQRRNRVKKE